MIMNFNELPDSAIQLGNRNDHCYLCAREIKAKTEEEYTKAFRALRGAHEGKPMLKIRRSGTEICICMEHIHKIAKENPLTKE